MDDLPGALRLAACLMVLILFLLLLEKWLRFGAKFHKPASSIVRSIGIRFAKRRPAWPSCVA